MITTYKFVMQSLQSKFSTEISKMFPNTGLTPDDATSTTTSRYVPCETLYILEDALFWSGGGWGNRNSKVQIDQRKSVYFITKTST